MDRLKCVARLVLDRLQSAELIICGFGLCLTTLLIFAQVLNRYWLHFEIMILGDLALYCFIFFMFIAGAVATWKECHVSVDAFRDKALCGRPRGLARHRAVLTVMSVVILASFLPQVHSFVLRALKYPEWGTLVRWFNHSWLMESFGVAMVLVLLHLLVIAGRDIKALLDERKSPEGGAR